MNDSKKQKNKQIENRKKTKRGRRMEKRNK